MMSQPLERRREELVRAIRQDRNQFVNAVDELEEVVRSRTNVTRYIAEKPYHWLSAGLVLGLLLGSRRR